jgi:hypothetical protein
MEGERQNESITQKSDFIIFLNVILLQVLLTLSQCNPNDNKNDDGSKATTS